MNDSDRRSTSPRRDIDVAQETRNVLTARDIADLHEDIAALRAQVTSLLNDRDKAMRWGVLTLGGAVVMLAGWIIKLVFSKVGL